MDSTNNQSERPSNQADTHNAPNDSAASFGQANHKNRSQESGQSGTPNAGQNTGKANCGCQASDMNTLMQECSAPAPLCAWVRYLRAPAMTLQYSMTKRHIPDLDAERQAMTAGGKSNSANASAGNPGNSTANTPKDGIMQMGGSCTVRYFDLALGAAVLLAVGAFIKCSMGCCRCMKRMF